MISQGWEILQSGPGNSPLRKFFTNALKFDSADGNFSAELWYEITIFRITQAERGIQEFTSERMIRPFFETSKMLLKFLDISIGGL